MNIYLFYNSLYSLDDKNLSQGHGHGGTSPCVKTFKTEFLPLLEKSGYIPHVPWPISFQVIKLVVGLGTNLIGYRKSGVNLS